MPFGTEKVGKSDERDFRVGILGWKPNWLQRFNNMVTFLTAYVILCLVYGMSNSYTSSMIPSIERRFGFSSKQMGIIIAMNDVSHLLVALLTAHFGGSGHRPRWIMCGCFVLGLALLLHATPEVLFPFKSEPALHSERYLTAKLCSKETVGRAVRNASSTTIASGMNTGACLLDTTNNAGPIGVFVLAQLLLGAGATSLMILGLPFIDDNVGHKNTPLYFAVSYSGRIFGPVFGYALGAFCNTVSLHGPDVGVFPADPRWISAWYTGFLATGAGLCLFSLFMGCFPSSIPKRPRKSSEEKPNYLERSDTEQSHKITWYGLPRNVKRLICNTAYMCRTLATLTDGLFLSGFVSFMPKFVGQQFGISGYAAAIAGGIPAVLARACGTLFGGILIRHLRPKPRHISLMLMGAAVFLGGTLFTLIALGCEKPVIRGLLEKLVNRSSTANTSCSLGHACGCRNADFDPVCHTDTGTTFVSPCQAGCQEHAVPAAGAGFRSCVCTGGATDKSDRPNTLNLNSTTVVAGICAQKCNNLLYYVALLSIAFFVYGIPQSGSIMLQYRVVDVDLKNLSSGFGAMIMSGLGYMPAPIIVGTLVDSTCRLWRSDKCGQKGSCLLYDTDDLRWKLHLLAGSVKLSKVVFDAVVTYKVWDLEFDRDDSCSGALAKVPVSTPISKVTGVSTDHHVESGCSKFETSPFYVHMMRLFS